MSSAEPDPCIETWIRVVILDFIKPSNDSFKEGMAFINTKKN